MKVFTIKHTTENKDFESIIPKVFSDIELANQQLQKLYDEYVEKAGGYINWSVISNYKEARIETEHGFDLFEIIELELSSKTKTRVINLYDCDTNFLVETNATTEEIEKAIAYKNDLLENDKPISSDFEAMQEYLMNKGYIFNEVGYVNEIESYEW